MKTISFLIAIFLYTSFSGHAQVRLNEVQSSNTTTIQDDFGEFDDWVEIHNPTGSPIEIGGLVLKDQVDIWAIPTGDPSTLLPAGGYFILWADDQEIQGQFHTNFKLASNGEFLGLYESDSTTLIESVFLPSMSANESYVRCTAADWLTLNVPTPLIANSCLASLNEINEPDKQLQKIIDLMGRETAFKANTPLVYIYSDGSVERVFVIN